MPIVSVITSLLLPSDAFACGGFFCNQDPIDQSGEDIVFRVDEERRVTTMHVQVAYQGSAEDFAWIVPVGSQPTIELSTNALFQELDWRTSPSFVLETKPIGDCDYSTYYYGGYAVDFAGSASPPSAVAESSTVEVVSQEQVGPYDTVVLRAQSAEGLLDWLQANEFDLPDDLDPVLQPYVAEEAYFVALRLANNQNVGALQPLALTYPGTTPSVPIRLTSIAATEDMRLRAYVLGGARAVPSTYLHVIVNDLAIDWFTWGSNYEQAITIAADEAGGQAFATDFSGDADIMDGALYTEGRFDIANLANAPDAFTFFERLREQGFRGDTVMLELFRQYLPKPESAAGVSDQDFYNCLSCDPWRDDVAAYPFDAAGFAQEIDERIVTPLRETQAMFDGATHLTSLTSSVSPIEMTVDPIFVFNRDMTQTVDRTRTAELEVYCADAQSWTDSPRRLVLADGRTYRLPSQQWFWDNQISEYEYLTNRNLVSDYALVVEQTSETGDPVPLYDGSDLAQNAADQHNASFSTPLDGTSCGGCNSQGPLGAGLGGLAAFGLLAFRRRRS